MSTSEPTARSSTQMSLERVGGWTVSTAGNGAEAVAKAVAEQPDAILMDVMMPGMDGLTACRLLSETPETRDIPIVLLTAKVQRADQQEWAELPIAGVLAKPFDPMNLCRAVSSLLGWSTWDRGCLPVVG